MALRCRAISFEARTMRAEPGGVATAAGERPGAGDAPATLDADCLCTGPHPPGQHIAFAAEYLSREVGRQIARRHGAAGALVHAPCNRRITAGDRFHALDIGRGIEFSAAE